MSKPLPGGCLIVDDDPAVRAVLRRVMQADGFDCREAASGAEALALLAERPVPLVLSDYSMDGMHGGELTAAILARHPFTAVVIITAFTDVTTAVRCLEAGALDYLTKPFSLDDLRARVRQALEKRRLLLDNQHYRDQLEERVARQARQYERLFLAALQSLADALEVRDHYTWGHSTRVSRYAVAIGRELGATPAFLTQLEQGSRLHDIGKIGVRESVLDKAGPLTEAEYTHIMEHPVIGWRLLAPLLTEMPHALAVVRSHHERFDGCGVPDRLQGAAIPLEARITAVADAFDAMTSGRPYREGMPASAALAELRRCAGSQFDPECVAAFERALVGEAVPWPDWSVRRRRPRRDPVVRGRRRGCRPTGDG